ncbi:hypothetical protein ABU614_06805 [Lysobacter firmicutimachus]|uniref:Uncharacterized protein n=1 Tax=Lysobacter firmicutimachus TaxID=1792846 RepID=A0AAU8MYP9_9GAMM
MDIEQDLFTLRALGSQIRWLLTAPTDLEPVWEYGTCSVDGCAALTRFLEPWTRIDRARRIDGIELHARVAVVNEEMGRWSLRVLSGANRLKQRPKRRNEAVAALLAATAQQIEDYLECRSPLTPRQWVEKALVSVERLHVLRSCDADFQHAISLAVGGLEEALGQFPE